MSKCEVEKSDYLVSLVGTSPMPNLIGTFTRIKNDGKIFLVYTNATREIAEKLKRIIEEKCEETNRNIEVLLNKINAFDDPTYVDKELRREFGNIFNRFIKESNKEQIELNFTGGTKVMSALSYGIFCEKCREFKANGVLTYLDGEKRQMICKSTNSKHSKVYEYSKENETLPIKIEDIANIHLDKDKKFNCDSYEASDFAKELYEYIKKNNEDRKSIINFLEDFYLIGQKGLKGEQFKDEVNKLLSTSLCKINNFQNSEQIINSYSLLFNKKMTQKNLYKHINEKLKGFWLEEITLHILRNASYVDGVASNGKVKMEVKEKNDEGSNGSILEVDILILNDHKLFVLSISTADNLELNKKKLYEVKERASSLGGSEVGIGLLTFYDNGKELENVIKEIWENDNNKTVRVFDWYDLPNLEEKFKSWICGGVGND